MSMCPRASFRDESRRRLTLKPAYNNGDYCRHPAGHLYQMRDGIGCACPRRKSRSFRVVRCRFVSSRVARVPYQVRENEKGHAEVCDSP
jgi:hypothetical protein